MKKEFKIDPKFLINKDNVKVGQTLWSNKKGYVEVSKININGIYPIRVGDGRSYTISGFNSTDDEYPTLFLDCPFLTEYPKEMLVRDSDNESWEIHNIIGPLKDSHPYSFFCDDGMYWKQAKDIEPTQKITIQGRGFLLTFDEIEAIREQIK